MIIHSCHIDAFGNIIDSDYVFSDGMNCTVEPNGFGKSTVADFIRCMLYGMPNSAKGSIKTNDRLRYLPFKTNGVFGGSLCIETAEGVFTISRKFHKSKRSEDDLVVSRADGSLLALPDGVQPGEYFFRIDEDAFRRTVFFSDISHANDGVSSESINRKLDVIVNDIDTQKLDKVLGDLDSQCREIKPLRASKINKGRIRLNQERIDDLNSQLNKLNKIQDGLGDKYKMFQSIEAELKTVKADIDKANDMHRQLALWRQVDAMESQLNATRSQLADLNAKYPKGIPTDDDIAALVDASDAYSQAEATKSALSCEFVDISSIKSLISKYPDGMPSDAEIVKTSLLIKRYFNNIKLIDEAYYKANASTNTKRIVSVVVCFVVLSAACFIALTLNQFIGMGLASFAVAGLIIALILLRNTKVGSDTIRLKEDNADILQRLYDFYAKYGYTKAKVDDMGVYLNEIVADCKRFADLSQAQADFEFRLQALKDTYVDTMTKAKSLITDILGRFDISVNDDMKSAIKSIDNDRREISSLTADINKAEAAILAFKESNHLLCRPDVGALEDLEALGARRDSLAVSGKNLEHEIADDERQLAEIDDVRAEIASMTDMNVDLVKKYDILQKVIKYIKEADNNLKERYIGPIKSIYVKYMAQLMPSLADDIVMDKDYKINILANGVAYDTDHLSQGELTCLELCMRIALIENMYKGEKPFLVFDDPFTELDAVNLKKVSDLISRLSDSYQIFYLTCHHSRAIPDN